jgi:hypothetical protein
VTLTTDNGGSNDDVFRSTRFSDTSDPDGQVPYSSNNGLVTDHLYISSTSAGNLVPEEGLASLIGEQAQGDWTLRLQDDAPGGTGELLQWHLTVVIAACIAPLRSVSVDIHPSGGISDQNGVAEPGERFVLEPRWQNTGAAVGESFDADGVTPPTLPAGWVGLLLQGQPQNVPWRNAASPFCDSPPNCAFSEAPVNVTENRLTSPAWVVNPETPVLFFRHSHDFQELFDGGVLEISIAGGPFQDIFTAGGSFAAGGYNGTLSTCCANPLAGRQAWTGNSNGFKQTIVVLPGAAIGQSIRVRFRTGTDAGVAGAGWFVDNVALGGEDVTVTGTAQSLTSNPPGPTATIHDGTADYGTIRRSAANGCYDATGNCYELSVPSVLPRPNHHWDVIFQEHTNRIASFGTYIHLGDSFPDVPRGSPYYRFVETIFHEYITDGCGGGNFCPTASVLREQMAVFLIQAMSDFGVPPCTV